MMLAHICRLRLAIRGLSGLVTFLVKTVDAWKSRPLMRSQYKSLWINKINSFDGRGGSGDSPNGCGSTAEVTKNNSKPQIA